MATTELTDTEKHRLVRAHPPTPGMLLAKLGAVAQRWYAEALKPTDLTPRHLGTLFQLRQAPMSQQDLVEAVGVDPSKLVGLLNDLEAEGLVLRRRDPADRRRHIVELSKEGRTRLAALERAAATVEERLLGGLDSAQRTELHKLLALAADTSGVIEGCSGIVDQAISKAD